MKTSNLKPGNHNYFITIRFILVLILLNLYSMQIKAQCNNNWSGSSPTITFQLDGTTISSFSIGFTDVGCFSSIDFTFSPITISNGSFSLSVNAYPNSGTISGSLSGEGNSFSGTYSINLAYLHPIYGYPVSCGTINGSWSANADTPRPVAYAGPDTTICKGANVTLTATGGVSYTWNGGITNGITFTPTETGTYTVTVLAANGCTDTDDVIVTVDQCTNIIAPFETSQNTNIYPNPTTDEFTLVIVSREPKIKVNVISVDSKVICSKEYKNNYTSTITERISLTDQNPGIYFVIINDGKKTISKKIILE